MKFWTFTLLSVLDAGCGRDVSGLPVTVCGMYLDVGVGDPAEVQSRVDRTGVIEQVVKEEFQNSLDPRLHDVCGAVRDYTVELRGIVFDPWEPSKEVGGFCDCGPSRLIRVQSLPNLPHEMAHAAQWCNWGRLGSTAHENWEVEVLPQVRAVRERL